VQVVVTFTDKEKRTYDIPGLHAIDFSPTFCELRCVDGLTTLLAIRQIRLIEFVTTEEGS
jgi:hypothetical protein